MQELIKVKKNIVDTEDDESNTPLHLACLHGNVDTARVLLQAGADPNARLDSDSQICVGSQFQYIAKKVQRVSFCLTCRHATSWTPIDSAASGGWDSIVLLLIEYESDLDPKDKANVSYVRIP